MASAVSHRACGVRSTSIAAAAAVNPIVAAAFAAAICEPRGEACAAGVEPCGGCRGGREVFDRELGDERDQRAAPATEGEPDGHRVADEDRGHDRVAGESTGASGAEPRSGEDERRRQHAQVVQQDRGDRVERGVERGVRAAGGPERGPGDGRGSTECRCRRERDPAEKRDPEIRPPTPGVGGCSSGAHARRGPKACQFSGCHRVTTNPLAVRVSWA